MLSLDLIYFLLILLDEVQVALLPVHQHLPQLLVLFAQHIDVFVSPQHLRVDESELRYMFVLDDLYLLLQVIVLIRPGFLLLLESQRFVFVTLMQDPKFVTELFVHLLDFLFLLLTDTIFMPIIAQHPMISLLDLSQRQSRLLIII